MTYFKAAAVVLCLGLSANAGHAESKNSSEGLTETQQAAFQEWRDDAVARVDELQAHFARLEAMGLEIRPTTLKAETFMELVKHLENSALEAAGAEAESLIASRLDELASRLAIHADESADFDTLLELIDGLWGSVHLGVRKAKFVPIDDASWSTFEITAGGKVYRIKAPDMETAVAAFRKLYADDPSTEEMQMAVEAEAIARLDAAHSNVHDALWERLDGVLFVMDDIAPLERWGCRNRPRIAPTDPDGAELILTADRARWAGLVEIKGLPPFKTDFRIDGLNRRWDWNDFRNSITIKPNSDGAYFEFPAEAGPGEMFEARDSYSCTSYPAVQPDPEPSPESQ